MSDLAELYQQTILDHGRNPRNHREIADPDLRAEGHNPLCGDRITVFVRLEGDRIADLGFQGSGCAISTASASLMSEALRGARIEEVEQRFAAFHDMVTGKAEGQEREELGKLVVFSGVCRFPVRIKCATLPWHTLRAAIERRVAQVSTEGLDDERR
jgi:nitrogen fixation NifU-like protein